MSGLLVGALACVLGALALAGRSLAFALLLCVIAAACLGYAAFEVLGFV